MKKYFLSFQAIPAALILCAMIQAALFFPANALAQNDPATSADAEAAKTVSRAYFQKYFLGDANSAQFLNGDNDLEEYKDEMARRKDLIAQLSITDVDWSTLPYSIRMLDGDQAVVMAVGPITVKTPNGDKTKDIQRVFKLEKEGGVWKIANSYYGDYKDEETKSYSEEKLKRIESQIAKDRLSRYEQMYTGVRKPYDPEKSPAPKQ